MLTEQHRESLALSGYAVVSALLPGSVVRAARDAICDAVKADLQRPETWYQHESLEWSVVPIHHAEAFWQIRQWPSIHATFSELLGTERLWVTMDRGVFKVPRSREHPEHVDESVLHWDLDPRVARAPSYQGMLYLTGARSGEGTFECVPGIFRDLDRYMSRHPGALTGVPVDVAEHDVVQVPVGVGDLVIWDARLPHHGGANDGPRPRVSMAISMHPEGSESERRDRIECWRRKRAPSWWRGWKGQVDPEPGDPAVLTSLGRRLVGLEPWP
jgi:Phytanoyl-CoA dioxygenase (PhyH)